MTALRRRSAATEPRDPHRCFSLERATLEHGLSTNSTTTGGELLRRLAQDFSPLRGEVETLRLRVGGVVAKSFLYASLLAVYAIRRTFSSARRELHFHPHIPDAEYTIWKVCALLGIQRLPLRPGADTVFAFDVDDFVPGHQEDVGPIIDMAPRNAINVRCTDISKTTVSRAFAEAFGYEIELDPTRHSGPLVEKSDANARHDGRVIRGPIAEPRPGRIYQRVVDNERPGGLVEDIRIPVMGASVPLVYLKYRPVERRFSNENSSVVLRRPSEVLSDDELEGILSVCARLGLDCGEVDAARDRASGRLYVVDVNKTCWGPPNRLSLLDCYRASWRLAGAFEFAFFLLEGGG
jgi:hypothetical protein